MAGPADLVRLRQALDFIPSWISNSTTHARLASRCETLGLPEPPGEHEGSKFERAFDAAHDQCDAAGENADRDARDAQ
jgi:hypothetical protein